MFSVYLVVKMQETSFSSFLKVVVLALVPLAAVMSLRECHNYKKYSERTSRNQDLQQNYLLGLHNQFVWELVHNPEVQVRHMMIV